MSVGVSVPEPAAGIADLGELYLSQRDGLVRLARLLTGSDSTAEELVQDAFVRLHTVRIPPDNPGGYLRMVVVNLCRDHLRRRARAGRHPVLAPLPATLPEIDETWIAVSALPPRQRAAVVLRYFLDLPEAEIAVLLGCRPGTVKSNLSRALAALRKELGR